MLKPTMEPYAPTHNGEDVTSAVSLLVVDLQLEGDDDVSALSVGEGAISVLLFSP